MLDIIWLILVLKSSRSLFPQKKKSSGSSSKEKK